MRRRACDTARERRRTRLHSCRGFTLLELVVALAILLIGLVTILEGLSAGLKAIRDSEDYTTATILGQQRLVELRRETPLRPGRQEGDFGSDYAGFTWETEVTPSPDPRLLHARIAVRWATRLRPRGLLFDTYLPKEQTSTGAAPEASMPRGSEGQ